MGAAETAQATGLAYKLNQVMAAVRHIEKDGRNEHHKFNFVSHDAVVNSISAHLAETGVSFGAELVDYSSEMTGSKDKGGNAVVRYVVRSKYRFTCVDTGESQEYLWLGEGVDSQDKGLYKAITQSKKTFLLNVFLVATGDKIADGDHGIGYENYSRQPKNRKNSNAPSRPQTANAPADPNPRRTGLKRALLAAMVRREPCDDKGLPVWTAVAKTISMLHGLPAFDPAKPSMDTWTEEQLKQLLDYYNSEEAE